MGFTEVVFKLRSDGFTPCALTNEHANLRVVLNDVAWDAQQNHLHGIVTLVGDEAAMVAAAARLPDAYDAVEVLSDGKEHKAFHVSAGLDKLRKSCDPLGFVFEHFGRDAMLQPSVIIGGQLSARLVVAGKVDLAAMLTTYEQGVRDGRWSDFKLVRIDDFDPESQVAGAFSEKLTQKQLEVIKTALALGFYNTPRDITLDDLSSIFGISKAAVHNRLQAAERKVIQSFFT